MGNGTEYRGVASTAASGLSCLAWNSDLLYQELHVDSVAAAALLGLGPHAYCRSALAWPSGQGPFWGRELLTPRLRASGPRGKSQAWDRAQRHCVPLQNQQQAGGGVVRPALLRVLSVHPRNPDKDERPWCYVVKDHALSWEYCHLTTCGARGWPRSH